MVAAPRWSADQLDAERNHSIEVFRRERLQEPVELYSSAFDQFQGIVEDLLEATVDLRKLDEKTLAELLSDKTKLDAFRYLSGPPISVDDLKTLAEAPSLSPGKLKRDPTLVDRLRQTVISCLDRKRFPWLSENREPSEAERGAAVLATSALMAYQDIQTKRRSEGKSGQEDAVNSVLSKATFRCVPTRKIDVLANAPQDGEFCRESVLGTRKADFVVGSRDGRKLAIECKVSNSSLNSVKRLNNDAAAKAEAWIRDFGTRSVVPIAVLSGVYRLANLVEAQDRGLTLFWAHRLDDFATWLASAHKRA